jgi:hypothetical protein
LKATKRHGEANRIAPRLTSPGAPGFIIRVFRAYAYVFPHRIPSPRGEHISVRTAGA